MILAQVLQLFGHVLSVGIFQFKGFHHLVLRVRCVKRSGKLLDFFEVGCAGKNHQRVGRIACRNFNDFLGLFARELLVKRLNLLGQLRGVDILQIDHAHNDIVIFFHIQCVDQRFGGGQIVVVIGDDQEIGPVIRHHHRLLGKDAFDFLGEICGRQMLQGKNLDQTLAASECVRICA